MKRPVVLTVSALAAVITAVGLDIVPRASAQVRTATSLEFAAAPQRELTPDTTYSQIRERWSADLAAMAAFRPGYAFWRHIFTISDGFIAYGSAVDGRVIAVFPTKGDWVRAADWRDPTLAGILDGHLLPKNLDDRREQVASLLEPLTGPVVHNPTRGRFLLPNATRYGRFLKEWGAIYERFGVPAEIGLAQAIIESGLNPTRRSPARAVGFCQWLLPNWRRLSRLSPDIIEAHNQTTQASYCAAYLAVLGTKYGSFIPALSEHNSGGTNVGRALISGGRLGGANVRDRYFLGSQFAHDVRKISLYGFREIYRTYGPRSYRYAEMVFGNTFNVAALIDDMPQVRIYAMRAPRSIPLAEITRRTRLSVDDVRRFNPAVLKRVPARGTVYLPMYVKEFGPDVSFWHRAVQPSFAAVLNDFVHLDATEEQWDDPSFASVLQEFQSRFARTNTEEGTVMATVLAYVIDEVRTSGRGGILAEYRSSDEVRGLFQRALQERDGARAVTADDAVSTSDDATQ